ncbi:serine hydrolase domain-containing protein [Paenibacillus paeoniae]|uniref:Class A beta-lactamase-related serine hydrolase n=1 Tax=Paenibacillus paeoniae TaxID=2292705 RepID=A0A371PLT8_9BACL|nr:serine hydrolase domain-containing protein [Paenibacillus paeoniae]REK76727.1 class A beta-lactamase-related serine hydrolase [Paenibacillus paeoniae]
MSTSKSKLFLKRFVLMLLIVLAGTNIGGLPTTVSAETSTSIKPVDEAAGSSPNLDDAAELETFIDSIINAQLEDMKIPGAVISIVKDGKNLLAKGYGFSNVEEKTPVDPETSLFRIASTTKLFTWTAVMQLVEQGKIDLDADINTYLKEVKIPATYKAPITMRHLMTHTAGFEDGGVGYQITTDQSKLPVSIAETLAKHMPARVKPPGEMIAYSNYGTALAGLIVEDISGMAYNDYIQSNIFDRLGMKFATVQEPVPAELAPYAAIGYAYENGGFVTKPLTFEGGFRPAGSGSVSAMDMSRFMIAHLQDGRYEHTQLLEPETAKLMHAPAFKFDERLPGMNLGFYELRMNGQHIISHGGADPLFNTELYLVPDQGIGIFVSYSGGEGGSAAYALAHEFFDRYFPVQESDFPPVATEFEQDLEKYAGSYQFLRRNHSDIDKFYSFLAQISIGVSGNRLVIGSGDEQQSYAPIGPNLFQAVGGTTQIGFRTDESGKVTHFLMDFLSSEPLERTPLINRTSLWLPLLAVSAIVCITILLVFPFRIRKIRTMPKPQRWAERLSVATAAWALMTGVATFIIVLNMDLVDRLSRITTSLHLYLLMPILLVIMAAAMVAASVWVWKNKYWSAVKRVHYTLAALAAVAFSLFFYHWNLLGWHFG